MAQNLVPNGSFEDTVPCAGWSSNKLPCLPWKRVAGSPDYLSAVWCYPWVSAPTNVFGYQHALSGSAYCGFMTYASQSLNTREYIQCPLTTTLVSGNYYYTSFYVSVSNTSHFAVDRIGAYFSIDSVHTPGYCYCTINHVPQVENDSGNIISDTLNWTLIAGYFYAAGGEQYITIGNFRKDNKTLIDTLSGTELQSYYYIDDVGVIDCTATGLKENNTIKFQLLENPVNENLQWITGESITQILIYDITGRLILSKQYEQNTVTYTIDVKSLKDGMYMVIVEDKNKRKGVRKFVKM